MLRILQALVLIALLTGCLKPHYKPPCIETPEEWRLKADEGDTLCNILWWQQFEDPALNELIDEALKNNQDLKAAIARVFEYYAHLGVVNADLYPTVYGNANYTRNKQSFALPFPLTPGTGRYYNDIQLFLNFTWEIDFWGKIRSAREAAYADLLAQIEVRRTVVMTLVSSVAKAYMTLLQLDMQLDISKKTYESRLQSLKLAQDRFDLGETSEIEVKQAASEVETALIRSIEFEKEIPKQENLISVLLGTNPHPIKRGKSLDALAYPINIPAGMPSDLLVRRPDIMEAEDQLISANARITEAKALFFPQVNLAGFYGNESDKFDTLFTTLANTWQYGSSIAQTIFDSGRIRYQVKEAKAFHLQMLFNYHQTILNAFKEVNDALVDVKKNKELVEEHKKQVAILTDYLHLANLRYLEGEIDYLNVLDAERSLFDAKLKAAGSEAAHFTAIIFLYKALGGGWVFEADAFSISPAAYLGN